MEGLMKKSFWIKLFLSYLAILAFSLAIGMFLFVSSLRRIKESTERYSRVSLLQVNESINQMQDTIQAISNTLGVREEYLSLMYADPELAASTKGMIKGRESMEQELAEEFGVTMDQLEGWLEEGDGFAVRFLGKRDVASKAIAVVRGGRNYTGGRLLL